MKNTFACFVIAFLIASCDKLSDSSSAVPPQSFKLKDLSETVFSNNSSELRCDALHQYLAAFAKERLAGGVVEQYTCRDLSGVENRFVFKAQVTVSGKTTVIVQNVSGKTAWDTEYCAVPFDGTTFESCSHTPFFQATETGERTDGILSPALASFKEDLSRYVSEPQTIDLAFGIPTAEFAGQWVAKLDGTYDLPLRSTSEPISVKIKLTPGAEGPKAGTAAILEAPSQIEHSLFGCLYPGCLLERSYVYRFNGHHLVLITSDGLSLSLTLDKLE